MDPTTEKKEPLTVGEVLLAGIERDAVHRLENGASAKEARDEKCLIDQGYLETAAVKLRHSRAAARQRREESQRTEATLSADEARLAKLTLRYRDAATLFAEAADLVRGDAHASWEYLSEQATALCLQSHEFNDSAALAESIAVYKQALGLVPRDRVPLYWAITQYSLANCLAILSERSPAKDSIIEEAIIHMQNAVEAFSETGEDCWRPIAEQRLAKLKGQRRPPITTPDRASPNMLPG